MIKMRMKTLALIPVFASLAVLALVDNARAGSSYTVDFGTSNFQNTPWSQSNALAQFNLPYERLNSITWSASAGAQVSNLFQNPTNFPSFVSLSGASTLTITNPAGGQPLTTLSLAPSTFTVISANSSFNVEAFDDKSSSGTISGSALTPYIGNGSLGFSISSSKGTGNPGGNPVQSLASINFTFNYSDIGLTQNDPILPTSNINGVLGFNGAPSGRWFDPTGADAYRFDMTTPGQTFTTISGFPTGFNGPVTVEDAFGTILGEFTPGQSFNFAGAGVTSFFIEGIDPSLSVGSPTGFPIQLGFSNSNASFTMTPLSASVPEPSSLVLSAIGSVLGIGFLGWKHKRTTGG
jgi:hypothetical protein